ncbi:MAG: DegT/DnrJ/EryC1/StrS family aminotransferase [Lentisphaerae bacterium]|nr:DegT/DnrJ/EryC1/StrS family aminotransferase [Lentisphaerota bacterium]
MNIPFVDLNTQYGSIQSEIDEAIRHVINDTAFVGGEYVAAFEKAFAAKCGVRHCISVGNGTDALFVALKMLGIGPGDEVITTAMSWIATSETITLAGGTPVFVDIEPDCYDIDVSLIEQKITDRTKAIIPVHLYGQPADIDGIQRICDRHGLFMLEDCAQAHFAKYKGQNVGTFGIAGAFSFYPGKNLGAYGDAGAIVTNDDKLAKRMRMFANHGALKKHFHEIEGINSRMDGIQAAILSAKLHHIDEWNAARQKNAAFYSEALRDIDSITVPAIRPNVKHVFHVYAIRSRKRDELQSALNAAGIATGIHYPTALPFLKAYERLEHKPSDFPVAHECQETFLSLPMYPELSKEQIRYVTDIIRSKQND